MSHTTDPRGTSRQSSRRIAMSEKPKPRTPAGARPAINSPDPPVASLCVYASTGPGSVTIDADASQSTGDQLECSWRFGDGSTGQGIWVTHTYATPGDYTVTLQVTD